jgi:cyclic pyranopterin monophosphate synthase
MSTSPHSAFPDSGGRIEEQQLSHIDDQGRAHMVDVTAKPLTERVALARCRVVTSADTAQAFAEPRDGLDVIESSRCAGVQAAKQASTLIPLCHPIRVDRVVVDIRVVEHYVEISAIAQIFERTGVEIEALTACAVCALSLLQPLLDVDPQASIEGLALWHKSGGRSGTWERVDEARAP